MKRVGWFAPALILVPIMVFITGQVISEIAKCAYDDIPNLWTCEQAWAVPILEDLDIVIFFVAYPILFIGILFTVFRLIWKR